MAAIIYKWNCIVLGPNNIFKLTEKFFLNALKRLESVRRLSQYEPNDQQENVQIYKKHVISP